MGYVKPPCSVLVFFREMQIIETWKELGLNDLKAHP